ncbi:MAG TPA: hypothetical protein VHZ24_23100 [Pirellulales bacterium]|jgi:hypothetical protein|nr:hypothetical protein [Pirellulales bacterium]
MNALMEGLLVDVFDPVRMQEKDVTDEGILNDRALFGEVLLQFAEESFTQALSAGALAMRFQDHSLLSNNNTRNGILRRLVKAGLVQPIGKTEYWVFKVPLVEYLIGWYLAHVVGQGEDGQRILITLFRRWIWQPQLHEILTFVFGSLWLGNAEQRNCANDLLLWAVEIGKRDVAHHGKFIDVGCDDLVHPFACSVMRWHLTDAMMDDLHLEEVLKVAHGLGSALSFAACHRVSIQTYLEFVPPHPAIRGAIAKSLNEASEAVEDRRVKSLYFQCANCSEQFRPHSADDSLRYVLAEAVAQWHTRPPAPNEHWITAIHRDARLVAEHEAGPLVSQLLRMVEGKALLQEALTGAVRDSAHRIKKDCAAAIVEGWMEEFVEVSDESTEELLKEAIKAGSRRIESNAVLDVVNSWLRNYRRASGKVKELWKMAIESASGNVDERESVRLCNTLIESEMTDVACRSAARSVQVAIVSESASTVTMSNVIPLKQLSPFVARLRINLKLDEGLVAVPESIRRLLLGPIRLSFKAGELLRALGEANQRADREKDASFGWLSMSAWFDAASVTRQRVDTKALIEELCRFGLVEENRVSATLHRYRITPAGKLHLAQRKV